MSQTDKDTFEGLISEANKIIQNLRKRDGNTVEIVNVDGDVVDQNNEEELFQNAEYPESLIKNILEKKYNLFLLRKLRVGNQETLNIFTYPPTIQKLIHYLSETDEFPSNSVTLDPKKGEYSESSQLILSTGRREISQLLGKEDTDFLLILFKNISLQDSNCETFSLHFSKILSGQLDYNYCETAQYINGHPEYLSLLLKYIGSRGVFDLFFELLSLHSKQHQPKIEWISHSMVSEMLVILIEELDKLIQSRRNNSYETDLSVKAEAIIQLTVYLFDVSPELSHPLFIYDNLSKLFSKIIESDCFSEFYQFLEKMMDINLSWIKRSPIGVVNRTRLLTTSSFGSFGNWPSLANILPSSVTSFTQTNQISITESMNNLLSSTNFVGDEFIPICVLEKGELVPITIKQLLLCLPRLKFRLYRYHPLDTLVKSSLPASFSLLPSKEEESFGKLRNRVSSQQKRYIKKQKNLKSPSETVVDLGSAPFLGSLTNKQTFTSQPTISVDHFRDSLNEEEDYKDIIGDPDREDQDEERDRKDEEKLIMVVVPLGLQRWAIVRVVLYLLATGYHCVDDCLVNSRILSVCIGLFLSHNCSNILHCTIVEIFYQIFQKNHMTIIQYLIEKLNLPALLIEAFDGLPVKDESSNSRRSTDFVTFREHLMIVISLVAKENRYAQNLLYHHERWKQFLSRVQPLIENYDSENFYKKNTHRLNHPHL